MLLSLLRQVSEDAKAKFKDTARSEKDEKIAKELTELMAGHVKHLGETIKKDELELEKEDQEQKKHITSDDIHEGFESKVFNFSSFLASLYRTQQQRSMFLPNQSLLQYHTLGSMRRKKRRKLLSLRFSIQRPQLRPQPTPKPRRMKKMPTSQNLRHHWKRFRNSLFTTTNNLSISFKLTAMSTFLVHLTLSWLPLSKHRAKGNRNTQSSVSTKVCSCSIVRNLAATVLVYSSRSTCLIFGLVVVPSFTLFHYRMIAGDKRADKVFVEDVENTYNHLVNRVKISQEEQSQGKEQIQLVAENPDTEIRFNVPDGPPPENIVLEGPGTEGMNVEEVRKALQFRWDVFQGFPPALQEALRDGGLDKVNKVLGDMDVPEAEGIVGDLDMAGILSFAEGGIRDETGATSST